MTPSLSTTSVQTISTQHGKHFQPMEIDSPAEDSHSDPNKQDTDRMDTSLDFTNNDETKGKEPEHEKQPESPGLPLDRPPENGDSPYLLCSKAHPPLRPHFTQDLLSLYNLQSLSASVARTDPVTGEKINKMRKSYEGKVKTFGLAGRNRAVKYEAGKPGGLMELAMWPEEEWQNQKAIGKEVQKGLPSAIMAKLERAMKMEPGPVPNNNDWEDLLGHEKAKPFSPTEQNTKKSQPEKSSAKIKGQTNGSPMTVGTPSAAEVARPKRSGRKRRYDEHSFEGYGEGYVDDDGEVTGGGGYSSGQGSRRSSVSKKKRKKEYDQPAARPALGERSGSYGVGMVNLYGR